MLKSLSAISIFLSYQYVKGTSSMLNYEYKAQITKYLQSAVYSYLNSTVQLYNTKVFLTALAPSGFLFRKEQNAKFNAKGEILLHQHKSSYKSMLSSPLLMKGEPLPYWVCLNSSVTIDVPNILPQEVQHSRDFELSRNIIIQ